MRHSFDPHDPRSLVSLLLLAFLIIWPLRMRWVVAQLFNGHDVSRDELAAIRERLELISAECPTHTFSAARAANVALGNHTISLVYGRVIVPTARGVNSTKSIYAIARGDEIDWMRSFSDVFELAFSGSSSSVFWVKPSPLIRLTKQSSERRTAVRSTF